MKLSKNQKEEEVARLEQLLDVNQIQLSNQSVVINRLRQQVRSGIKMPKELDLAHQEVERYKKMIEEAQEEKKQLQKKFDDFQQIILRWGFGGGSEDIDLSIIDKFNAQTWISRTDIDECCEDWKTVISYPVAAERVSAVELWMLSIAEPAKFSMTTIIGFVQSNPEPNQLAFLEAAIANVIAHTTHLDFQQAAFVLRGVELLWMATNAEKLEPFRVLISSVTSKLPKVTFVNGLYVWLTSITEDERERTRDEEIMRVAKENALRLDDGVTLIMDDFIILIRDGTITLADKKRLQSYFDTKDDCWVVWIDGYPQAGAEIKTKFPFGIENLELLSRAIGQF